jgi:hypothetical protein
VRLRGGGIADGEYLQFADGTTTDEASAAATQPERTPPAEVDSPEIPLTVSRILSQHGNVIAADFRPRTSLDLTISLKADILYADEAILVMRYTATLGKEPIMVTHFIGDIATGNVVQLNNKDVTA